MGKTQNVNTVAIRRALFAFTSKSHAAAMPERAWGRRSKRAPETRHIAARWRAGQGAAVLGGIYSLVRTFAHEAGPKAPVRPLDAQGSVEICDLSAHNTSQSNEPGTSCALELKLCWQSLSAAMA